MSNLPTPINLVDTETIQWTGDNSNPRNAYANVETADGSTHGAVLMRGDFGGSGESPAVVGITGILFDQSITPTEDYQAPQFVADSVSDAGVAFGHLKFGHLSGGVDARSTTTETVNKSSFAKLVSFSDSSPAADVAVALDSTVNAHFWCFVRNATASHALNFTPSTGSINTSTLASGSAAALYFDGTNWTLVTFGGAGGSGTVTSVALTVPSWLSVSGSPITTSGTLAVTAASGQTANQVLATPNGSTGAVSLRALVASDIPNIAESQVTNLTTDLAAKVPTSRTISTTAPLTGGGDLSANRTLDISNFTGDSGSGGAKGAVPAPAAGDAAAGKFLKANGSWATPATSSVLTTKGDLVTHDTADVRLAVGSDGQVLIADSAQTSGIKWGSVGTISGGYSNTPPIEANFSWVNQGAYAFSGGTTTPTFFYSPSGATGVNLHCRVMTAPATPWSFKLRGSAMVSAGGGVIWRFGIVVRDSATGKMVTIDLDVNSAMYTTSGIVVPHVIKWNSATSFSGFYSPSALLGVNGLYFAFVNFKVVNDGTNLKWYVDPFKQQGGDTENWQLIQTNLKADFLANIDQVGYYADNEGVGSFVSQIYDWIQGTS